MTKLVYCSYNLIDQDEIPDWVDKFIANPLVQKEKWAIYNPINGFGGNLESNLSLPAALSIGSVPDAVVRGHKTLKLDPMLLEPLGSVLSRLRAADEAPTLDVAFKSLYVLLRSDIVLVDLNQPGHGEASQEVVYAYLSGIPIVGIAHRFILSPWMINKLNAVIFPRTSDEIVQQVLAHDHKTTVMLEHYRAEHQEAERQANLEKSRAERAAARAGSPSPAPRTTGAPIIPSKPEPKAEARPKPKKKAKRTKKKKGKGVGDGGQPGAGSV
jgi:hypothetical protein